MSLVQSLSRVQFFETPWTTARQTSLSIINSQNLLTYVHRVGDAIQPSHLLSFPSPPAFNLSQNQGVFWWVSSLYQVAKVLELQLQYQAFQWIFRIDFFEDWLVWSPSSPRDSQESSPTPQFESMNTSALSLPRGPPLTSVYDYWKNHSFDHTFVSKVMSLLLSMPSRFVIAFLPRSTCLLI